MAITRAAPYCRRQSVNPPVEAPTSRQIFPVTLIFQCSKAASDVFQIFSQKPHLCFSVDRRARFLDFLPIDQNFAGENQGLGALTRTCQPAFQQQFIQAEFQIVFPGMMSTTKVPATKPVQGAEPTLDKLLTDVLSRFSTESCTGVLKSFHDSPSLCDLVCIPLRASRGFFAVSAVRSF